MAKRKRKPRGESKRKEDARNIFQEFEIGLGKAVLGGDRTNVDALHMLGQALTRARRHKEALEVDLKLVEILPDDPISHYNLACSYSLMKKLSESIGELRNALKLGYNDIPHMLKDRDLANVRKDRRFRRLVEKRWGRRQSSRRKKS